jgi:3-hydroxyacyl-CoA dehydrogenase
MQQAMLRLRYASVPVVSAMRGLALGGGCELAVYSQQTRGRHGKLHRSGGGGRGPGARRRRPDLHRPARGRAMRRARPARTLLPFLTEGFTAAAMAKVGTSAMESRKLGYLLDSDMIVPHKDELLFVAINEAARWPPRATARRTSRQFAVAGRNGLATIKGSLVNMRDGGFISQHDFHIASLIANVVCGGDVDAGTLVTEEYLMALERKAFCTLLTTPKPRNASWA